MSPLPSTKVLPDGWSAHHAPAAEGFLTGTCRADRPQIVGDWEAGSDAPQNTVGKIWGKAPCSAQILSQSVRPVQVADSTEVIATHRVSVPLSTMVLQFEDLLTITDNPDDPGLNGRKFRILVVEKGTTNWTREYLCQERNAP